MTVVNYSTKSRVNASTGKVRTSAASIIDVPGSLEKPQVSGIIGEHISLRASPPHSSSSMTKPKRKQTSVTLLSGPAVNYGDGDFADHDDENTHSDIAEESTGDASCRQTTSSMNKLSMDAPNNRLQNAVDTEVVFFNEQAKSKRLYRETSTLV